MSRAGLCRYQMRRASTENTRTIQIAIACVLQMAYTPNPKSPMIAWAMTLLQTGSAQSRRIIALPPHGTKQFSPSFHASYIAEGWPAFGCNVGHRARIPDRLPFSLRAQAGHALRGGTRSDAPGHGVSGVRLAPNCNIPANLFGPKLPA